jgi:hypothetical protein
MGAVKRWKSSCLDWLPIWMREKFVDLGSGVLVAADDDGLAVAPEHEDVFVGIVQQPLLGGEVEGRVRVMVVDVAHGGS